VRFVGEPLNVEITEQLEALLGCQLEVHVLRLDHQADRGGHLLEPANSLA
jgi:hypothetical protein